MNVGWGSLFFPCAIALLRVPSSLHAAAFPSPAADRLQGSLALQKGNIGMSLQFWQQSLAAKCTCVHMCMHVPCCNSHWNSCPVALCFDRGKLTFSKSSFKKWSGRTRVPIAVSLAAPGSLDGQQRLGTSTVGSLDAAGGKVSGKEGETLLCSDTWGAQKHPCGAD